MNREVSPPATGSVTGDFVLALGPGSRAWLSGLPGFRLAAQDGEAMCLAVRGAATVANPGDGCGWMAVSDLVEGELADGVRNPQESPPQRHWRGRFAQLAWDGASGTITAFTDHFASVPIYWYRSDRLVAVASDLRLLLSAPGCMASPDPEAIYHYLNFACIPAPLTICKQVRKIEPGTRLQLSRERVDALRYYLPEYPEDLDGSDDGLADELRERIITSVRDFRPSGMGDWGCFLSGGTDSSSVVTILARQKPGRRVRTCSSPGSPPTPAMPRPISTTSIAPAPCTCWTLSSPTTTSRSAMRRLSQPSRVRDWALPSAWRPCWQAMAATRSSAVTSAMPRTS